MHNSHTPSRSSACTGTVPASTAAPDLCRRPIPICADVLTNTAGPTLPVWADRGRLLLAARRYLVQYIMPPQRRPDDTKEYGPPPWLCPPRAKEELAVSIDVVEARHCWDQGAKSAARSQPWLLCPRGLGPVGTTWYARKVWGKEVCAPTPRIVCQCGA